MKLRDIFGSASCGLNLVDKYKALILLVMLCACSSKFAALPRPTDSSFEGAWLGQSTNSQELTTRVRLFFFRSVETVLEVRIVALLKRHRALTAITTARLMLVSIHRDFKSL